MNRIPVLAWCILSSLLLWLAYFPMNWGWLGWVALMPLVMVLEGYVSASFTSQSVPPPQKGREKEEARRLLYTRRPLLSAWIGGLAFCLVAFQWIRIASASMYATWIVLALVVSLQWVFFFLFTRLLYQTIKLPLLIAAPVTWTALEYLRSQIWIGFAWYYLGHTQHEEIYFIQAADLVGVYGLSFIIMMVNVALYRTLVKKSWRVASLELAPAVALVGLASWYGSTVITQDAEQFVQPQTKRIAILQGNQPQDLRNDPESWKSIDKKYSDLGDAAALQQPALIIAPETCLSLPWIRLKDDRLPDNATVKLLEATNECRKWAYEHAGKWKADLLIGFNTLDFRGETMRHTNSAVLLDQKGQERGCYDKIVCLPFGEYIPWAETLPFMKWLSPYPYEYTIRPGTELNTLVWDNHRIAALICYEDTVPDLAHAFMRQENPDFFVNLSNDGWFKGWEEHEQHLVCARFRCIETRRSMVRAVNMGISCIIDGMGRIVVLPQGSSTWHDAKDREAVIVGTVPLYQQTTLYVKRSDLLPWICWGIIVLTFGISFFYRPSKHVVASA